MKKVTVIKFGGSLAKNEAARRAFLKDVAALSRRNKVVLVHGGGPEINALLERLGIRSSFVGGLRYTDAAVREVVEMVLCGKVNKDFVAALQTNGADAVGISGVDGKTALCRRLKELGFVGEPRKIGAALVRTLLSNGYLPVISSVGLAAGGEILNVNADSLAMALAAALRAERLILLTDVPGVLDEKKRTIPEVRTREVAGLLRAGVITGGMIPKIRACCGAIRAGIGEVWIVDGSAGLRALKGTLIRR